MTEYSEIIFRDSHYFLLTIVSIAFIIYFLFKKRKQFTAISFSSTKILSQKSNFKKRIIRLPLFLRIIASIFIIFALSRPQSTNNWQENTTEGIDVIMAIDISGSMLAEDLKPNRLEAAKNVAIDFISNRSNDRIGLVVFSGESFTQCPLTTDHTVLVNLFKDIKSGMVDDGTALGMGIATSVNRLKESDAKSKVIVLVTDGVNNSGEIAPLTAAELCKSFGIRIYTIGIGTLGLAPYPFQTPFGIQYQDVEVKIDEKTLQDIAMITKGKFFRATNNSSLKKIYDEIDLLEKSKIKVTEFSKKKEEFRLFLYVPFLLLIVSYTLENTILKRLL